LRWGEAGVGIGRGRRSCRRVGGIRYEGLPWKSIALRLNRNTYLLFSITNRSGSGVVW
jgi:hypothetical protein